MKFNVFNKKLILIGLSMVLGINGRYVANIYASAPVYQSEFKEGNRVEYHIKSEEDYRRVITERNRLGYSGVVIYLDNDIEFQKPVIPIGGMFAPFEGKFFGQGHTLSNVFFDWKDLACSGGVFEEINAIAGKKVEVSDLKISSKDGKK